MDLVANFTLNSYTVTVSADPIVGGDVDGAGTYLHGNLVEVTATPSQDYTFLNWTKEGVVVSTDSIYRFPAIENANLVAHFKYDNGMAEPITIAEFKVYPNPTNGLLHIVRPTANDARIEIFNMLGVMVKALHINEMETTIDISTFTSGIYLIRLSDHKNFSVKKIVKE
jgi:hypothetical protein